MEWNREKYFDCLSKGVRIGKKGGKDLKLIILAGEKDTRLWPSSREKYSKQFFNIVDKKPFVEYHSHLVSKIEKEEKWK